MKPQKSIAAISILFLTTILFGCVQEQHEKKVTFKVNTNGTAAIAGVAIAGEFSSPPWSTAIPLKDVNADGIYEITITDKTAVREMEFKFVTTDGTYELEDKDNRILHFQYRPETLVYEAEFDKPDGKQTSK